jgi:hypothetical protein
MCGSELPDPDDERRQAVDLLPVHLEGGDLTARRHLVQPRLDLPGRPPEPAGDGRGGLRQRAQARGEGGVLGREDLGQDAQLDTAVGAGKAVRQLVQLARESTIGLVHRTLSEPASDPRWPRGAGEYAVNVRLLCDWRTACAGHREGRTPTSRIAGVRPSAGAG